MSNPLRLWMRCEERAEECRAPISPHDASVLRSKGVELTVERSSQRSFPIAEYAKAGCQIAEAGSWPDAPDGDIIVGLKELPEQPDSLRHHHVFFGHAFKGQPGAEALLKRFIAGDGALLDLEYVTDPNGRRLFAFGYWAGYVGAALALLQWASRDDGGLLCRFPGGLRAMSRDDLQSTLRAAFGSMTRRPPNVLIIGALGRCGSGARQALRCLGLDATCWDVAETVSLDRDALLAHDILINAVQISNGARAFMTAHDVVDPERTLSVIADVTCDVGSACNALPIYDRTTSWSEPVARLYDRLNPLDLIAIDNLPSLLPFESSLDFSAALAPHLANLKPKSGPWLRSQQKFEEASRAILGGTQHQTQEEGAFCDA